MSAAPERGVGLPGARRAVQDGVERVIHGLAVLVGWSCGSDIQGCTIWASCRWAGLSAGPCRESGKTGLNGGKMITGL